MSEPLTIVKCPTCSTPVVWTVQSRYRPFCSERCKLIDLGAWADETYSVEAQEDQPLSDDVLWH